MDQTDRPDRAGLATMDRADRAAPVDMDPADRAGLATMDRADRVDRPDRAGLATTDRADPVDMDPADPADRPDRAGLATMDRADPVDMDPARRVGRGMGMTSAATSAGPHGATDPRLGALVSRRGPAGADRYRRPEDGGTVAPSTTGDTRKLPCGTRG
jgi:hypothetical protein